MRFYLPYLFSVCTALAQLPPTQRLNPLTPQPPSPLQPPSRPTAPTPANPVPAVIDPAISQYQGPFYPVAGDPQSFRTRLGAATALKAMAEYMGDGAVLTGFDCTVEEGSQSRAITFLQPIYLVNGQRRFGASIGAKTGATIMMAAKPGYAVSKVEVCFENPRGNAFSPAPAVVPPGTGGSDGPISWMRGIRVSYARLEANGTLNLNDQYQGQLIGYGAPQRFTLDGMGVPIAGVIAAYTAKPSMLGLAVSARVVRANFPGMVPVSLSPATAVATPATATPPITGMDASGFPVAPPTPSTPPAPSTAPTPSAPPVATLLPEPEMPAIPAAPAMSEEAIRLAQLSSKAAEAFVFIEGQGGVGSAFVCRMNNKRYLLTNQHVIRENAGMRFTRLNQENVKLGPSFAAVGHDLISFEISEDLPALESEIDFASNIAIGDAVMVIGNTEGQRVIKPLPGNIIGLGPNLVEISSEFLPGNSGSPIIHVKSGRVIGIATYATIRNVNSLTGQNERTVRRFGYRLDSVKQWQPVNWAAYQAEAAMATKVHEFSDALIALLNDIRTRQFSPERHSDGRLRAALNHLKPLTIRGNKSEADIKQSIRLFIGELKNTAVRDVEAARAQIKYDFFQRELQEETKFRTELSKALGEALVR